MGSNPSAFFSIQVALCYRFVVECAHYTKCLSYRVAGVYPKSGQIKKVAPLKHSNGMDDRKLKMGFNLGFIN